jgi:hypothetical protein
MNREKEFLEKYRADLRRAIELCGFLQRGAVELVEYRQRHLRELRRRLQTIEGACRQIAMERGEDEIRGSDEFGAFPWLEKANFFGSKVRKAVDRIARDGRTDRGKNAWLLMKDVALVFQKAIAHLDRMADRPTGNSSLSFRPTQSLLILPPWLRENRVTLH